MAKKETQIRKIAAHYLLTHTGGLVQVNHELLHQQREREELITSVSLIDDAGCIAHSQRGYEECESCGD